ncbi:hypothetical protein CSOJ01_10237 [Colletotrichum sojae]|uniref:Uncharacterized protein n=1 Tax=Colletotrichum sojae TaxID=2175907 RepID=A0A8H6J0X0_9PEZI|nr:hypothetical protein CSOJ01_10237 [Colletotrichum sojae]
MLKRLQSWAQGQGTGGRSLRLEPFRIRTFRSIKIHQAAPPFRKTQEHMLKRGRSWAGDSSGGQASRNISYNSDHKDGRQQRRLRGLMTSIGELEPPNRAPLAMSRDTRNTTVRHTPI